MPRRRAFRLAALLCGTMVSPQSALAAPSSYFLSPTGNDFNTGNLASPFATLGRAQQAIDASRNASAVLPGPVMVTLLPGTYYLASTAALNASISGDDVNSVTIAAQPGAVLSGGMPLTGWLQLGPDLFTVNLPLSTFPQQIVRQLWTANGTRRELQHSPILHYASLSTNLSVSTAPTYVVLPRGQLNATAEELSNAYIVLYHSWTSTVNQVASWDPGNSTLMVAGGPADNRWNSASFNRYVLQNVLNTSYLAPGTFMFNATSRNITYRAMPGEDPRVTPLIAPRLSTVLSLTGTTSRWLRNVYLADLTVAHTPALLEEQCKPVGNGCSSQSGAILTTAAVELTNVRNATVLGLSIAHTGGYALWLRPGCQDLLISRAHLFDLGAGGVRIGPNGGGMSPIPSTVVNHVELSDSVIEDGGHILEAGVGVLLQTAHNVSIVHNSIHDFFYSGISTGWTWGYSPTSTGDLTVGWNHIYNVGRGRLSDLACIYNLGTSRGTVFVNNVCHDAAATGYGGWGYYTDEVRCRELPIVIADPASLPSPAASQSTPRLCNHTLAP